MRSWVLFSKILVFVRKMFNSIKDITKYFMTMFISRTVKEETDVAKWLYSLGLLQQMANIRSKDYNYHISMSYNIQIGLSNRKVQLGYLKNLQYLWASIFGVVRNNQIMLKVLNRRFISITWYNVSLDYNGYVGILPSRPYNPYA